MVHFFIIITGPTGVGKTDLIHFLSTELSFPVEVINADMGQLYTPLSIGTAKPDYHSEPVKHYLFDVIDTPVDCTVMEYRTQVIKLMHDMWERNVVPLIVGGSGFYISSLFFTPHATNCTPGKLPQRYQSMSSERLWHELATVDPLRAQQLHAHDRYRIERALALWQAGILPSSCLPTFDPPGCCAFYFLNRDRADLTGRIERRVKAMLDAGWIDEVKGLDEEWRMFLKKKKLIGYKEIMDYLSTTSIDQKQLIAQITQKTTAYAKRQLTFWRMLEKKLRAADPEHCFLKEVKELNLTLEPLSHYTKQLREDLNALYARLSHKKEE